MLWDDDKMLSYVADEVVRVDQEPHTIKPSNSQVHRHRTYLRRRESHHKDRHNPGEEVVGLVRLPIGHMEEELLHVHNTAGSSVAS